MKKKILPIKEQDELNAIMHTLYEYDEKPAYYLITTLILQTGITPNEAMEIKRKSIEGDFFFFKGTNITYFFDEDFHNRLKFHLKITPESPWLFPKISDPEKPMPYRTLVSALCRIFPSQGVSPFTFRVTFAYHYFIQHGNLKLPTFRQIMYQKNQLCDYLGLSAEEYGQITGRISSCTLSIDQMEEEIIRIIQEAADTIRRQDKEKESATKYLLNLYRISSNYINSSPKKVH